MDVLERSGPQPSLRAASDVSPEAALGDMRTLVGHLAVFDTWTEIDSDREGRFMERIAPGAFARTLREDRAAIKVTLNHGRDPQLGDKPLGPIDELEEDAIGARYAVPLLGGVPELVVNGLEAGLYGSSFRFAVRAEDMNRSAKRSAYNPEGLPERTIRDAQLFEFGPVTYPAYLGATAGLRSRWTAARRARALILARLG